MNDVDIKIFPINNTKEDQNNVRDKNSSGKISELKEILEYCYSTNNLIFENKETLVDFDKLNYSDIDEEDEESDDSG